MLVVYEMTARRKNQSAHRDCRFMKKVVCETCICVVGSKCALKSHMTMH